MIVIENVSHRYPHAARDALHRVNLNIGRGECWGLLGHNGAGKTTLMSLLAGLQEVQQGEIVFDGVSSRRLSRDVRQKIGLVPQDFAFYPQLSVWDNLLFFASLYRVRDKTYLAQLLAQTDLTEHRQKAAGHLSGGLKRRLNFAIGLINRPEILFLDEITVGIDPQSRRFILESVAAQTAQGVTVIYTSHYLQEIEQLCSRLALLNGGKLVYHGAVNQLLSAQQMRVRFALADNQRLPEHLAPVFQAAAMGNGVYEVNIADETHAAALYQGLQQSGARIAYFQQGHGSLESFYLDFLRRHEHSAAEDKGAA